MIYRRLRCLGRAHCRARDWKDKKRLEALDIDEADAIELEGDTLTLLVTVRSCSRRALLSEGNASLDDLSQI